MGRFNKATSGVVGALVAQLVFIVFPDVSSTTGLDQSSVEGIVTGLFAVLGTVLGPKNKDA